MLSRRIRVALRGMSAAKTSSVLRVALLLLLASVSLFSQGSQGSISGTVTDQSGAAIAGAKVTVTDVQRNVSRALTTDSTGAYAAPDLIPSTYNVRVEFSGFKNSDRAALLLEVAQDLRVDLTI